MMKKKWFERPPHFKKRLMMMLVGVFFQGFGLSLLRQFDFGTDPCALFAAGMANYLPFSFGTCQLLENLVMMVFVLGLDASYVGFGTLGNMIVVGYTSDFFSWIWKIALPAGFLSQKTVEWILILPVLALFILAASVYMSAGLGSAPYDSLPFILSERQKKVSFRTLRMCWDIGFTVGGVLMGAHLGLVTVIMAFFLGPVIGAVRAKIEKLLA